jgi:hypothetical protein
MKQIQKAMRDRQNDDADNTDKSKSRKERVKTGK